MTDAVSGADPFRLTDAYTQPLMDGAPIDVEFANGDEAIYLSIDVGSVRLPVPRTFTITSGPTRTDGTAIVLFDESTEPSGCPGCQPAREHGQATSGTVTCGQSADKSHYGCSYRDLTFKTNAGTSHVISGFVHDIILDG